jgi:hypothetical protein
MGLADHLGDRWLEHVDGRSLEVRGDLRSNGVARRPVD